MGNTLYLIRHGDTEGTIKDLFYGSTDLPLVDQGVQQVKALRGHGVYPSPDGAKLYTCLGGPRRALRHGDAGRLHRGPDRIPRGGGGNVRHPLRRVSHQQRSG